MTQNSSLTTFLSFRFSTTDGVSTVTANWRRAFETLGFDTQTVSGEPGSDYVIDGLGLVPTGRDPQEIAEELETALEHSDIVVVENLLTIPMNLAASAAAVQVLRGRRALVHHHDPPWQRERFSHIAELPVDSEGWIHVSINRLLREELRDRGIESTLIYNGFQAPSPESMSRRETLRASVRAELSVDDGEILVAHPVRAIKRKNIPLAVELCEEIEATYWLLGPAEEDYAGELDRHLRSARCRVIHQPRTSRAEIYAACDHVAFPSTWEGFGNPPIEASLHRRSVSVGPYPVGAELRDLGFTWLDSNDFQGIAGVINGAGSEAVETMLDNNEEIARSAFSFETMTGRLRSLLSQSGWLP